jgi:hypothetical protein
VKDGIAVLSPAVLRSCSKLLSALIEGRDHCLGDIRKEVIDAEARTGEWVHPIVFEQAANDEFQQKIGKVAHMDVILMEPEAHTGGAPVDRHAH